MFDDLGEHGVSSLIQEAVRGVIRYFVDLSGGSLNSFTKLSSLVGFCEFICFMFVNT